MKINKSWMKALTNITFVMAIGLSLYLLMDFYISRRNLPPMVCPVESNRVLIYVAILLAISSFILSVIESRLEKD